MKKIILFVFFTCVGFSYSPVGAKQENNLPSVFSSLRELQDYSVRSLEYPNIDNRDWMNPNYTSFFKSIVPGFFDNILTKIGFKKSLWSSSQFLKTVEVITKLRELNGYVGRFVQKIDPVPGSQFFILCGMHGGFHSLVRDLTNLQIKGIMNEDLEIINKYSYIVFNGNVIDQGPYSLETLTLVIQLMLKNPARVLYLRGSHEDIEQWQNFSLKNELEIRVGGLKGTSLFEEKIPLNRLINRFFDTLPMALFLVGERTEKTVNVVLIAHPCSEVDEIDAKKFAGFLDVPGGSDPQMCKVDSKLASSKTVEVKAYVRCEKLDIVYKKTDGLRYLGKEKGITSWALMSSPIESHRRLFEFFYDAFAVITTYAQLNDWTIALFNQDVREKQGFIQSAVFNLTSGLELTQEDQEKAEKKEDMSSLKLELEVARQRIEVLEEELEDVQESVAEEEPEKKEFLVGSLLDFTKGFIRESRWLEKGVNAAFEQTNNEGGVDGMFVKLIARDDEYTPEIARKNAEQFIKEKINRTICSIGTPTFEAYLDLVKNKELFVFFPVTGASIFRKPDLVNILNLRPSYRNEGYILTKYAIQKSNSKKIMFLYQNDSFGIAILDGAHDALKELNAQDWLEVSYERNVMDFDVQIDKMVSYGADAIMFFGTTKTAYEFVKQAEKKIQGKKLFGIQTAGERKFKEFLKENNLSIVNTSVVPNPVTSNLPIVQDYRKEAGKSEIGFGIYELEGYISGRLFTHLMKKVEGSITSRKIMLVGEAIENEDFGGIKLDFDQNTRQLSHTLWLDTGKDEWEPQDVRTMQEKTVAVERDKIKVGSSMDLSKGVKHIGQSVKKSMDYIFSGVNKKGGIHGKKVEFNVLDDEYDPNLMRKNIETLYTQLGTNIIIAPVGTAPLQAALDFIEKNNMLVLFPTTSSSIFYKPSLTNLMNLAVSYFDEGYFLTKYMIEKNNIRKFAFFYQNDDFGKDLLNGAKKALKEAGIPDEDQVIVSYERNLLDFQDAVPVIENSKAEAIGFFSTSIAAQSLIRQLNESVLRNKKLFGCSDLAAADFKRFAKARDLEIVIANGLPNPQDTKLEVSRKFQEAIKQSNGLLSFDYFSFYAYISATLFVDVLNQIKGPVTLQKIKSIMESMKNYNFNGLDIAFDPQTRQMLHTLWLDIGKDEWIPVQTKKIEEPVIKEEPEPVEKGPLKLGTTLDFSKGVRVFGKQIKEGLLLAIDKKNKQGGINGRIIELFAYDDGYEPMQARKNIERLLSEENIDIILSPLGTPTMQKYVDLAKEGKILIFFPNSDFRDKNIKNLLFCRASGVEGGNALINYGIKRGLVKFAFLYQDDIFGGSFLKGAKEALNEAGISSSIDLSYKHHDTDFTVQAAQLKEKNYDALGLFATATASINFMRTVGLGQLVGKELFGSDDLGDPQFLQFKKRESLTFNTVYFVPNPATSDLEIVKEFRELADKSGIVKSSFALEGYITASLAIEIMNRIKGPITKEKIVAETESIKDWNYKGLNLTFNLETRSILNTVWLDTGDPKWKEVTQIPAEVKVSKEVPMKEEVKEESGPIKFGTTADLTKGISVLSKNVVSGVKLRLNDQNKKGGVRGRILDFEVSDDGYSPLRARENVENFLSKGIDLILCPVASATLNGYLDLVKQKKITVLFPITGSPEFRDPDLTNLLNFRASNATEAEVLVDYLVTDKNVKQFALFYQDDVYGKGCLKGARAGLKKAGIKDWIELPYNVKNVDYSKQVAQLKDKDFEALGFLGISKAAINFIRQLGVETVSNKKLFGIDALSDETFKTFLKNEGLKFIIGNAVPNPETSEIEIVKEYRKLAKEHGEKVSSFGLEAFIGASLTVYILEQVKGPITKETIIKAAESIKNINYKGLELNFDPQTRSLMHKVWIETGDPDWQVFDKSKKEVVLKTESEQKIIKIGSSIDTSKGLKYMGIDMEKVMNHVVNEKNAQGGIHGKKIELTVLDNEYTPAKALETVKDLYSQDIKTILIPSGTATLQACTDFIVEQDLLALFSDSGSKLFRKPELTQFINLIQSFYYQGYELTKYVLTDDNIKNIIFFYQADGWGNGLLEGAEAAINQTKKNNIKMIKVPYDRNDLNFTDLAKSLSQANHDAIVFFASDPAARSFIRQVGISHVRKKKIFGVTSHADQEFRSFLKQNSLKMIIASVFPDPTFSDIAIAKTYRGKTEENKQLPLDIWGFYAYVATSLLLDVLEKIDGPITNEKIQKQFEAMDSYKFGGLTLTFDPKTRQLLQSIWIIDSAQEFEKEITSEININAGKVDVQEKILPQESTKAKLVSDEAKPTQESTKTKLVSDEAKPINVGTTLDKERDVKDMGIRIENALKFIFDRVNKAGGVNGHKIAFESFGDSYDPVKARENIEIFVNKLNTDIILLPVGTPTLANYLDYVKEKKIIVLFPDTGSLLFRKPDLTNLINLRPSGYDEVYALTTFIIKKYNTKKFAFFCLDNQYGKDLLKGAQAALRDNNINDDYFFFYNPKDLNFSEQVQKIHDKGIEAIGLFSAPFASKEFLRQLDFGWLRSKEIYGPSELDITDFETFLKDNSLSMILPRIFPGFNKGVVTNGKTEPIPIIEQFKKDVKTNNNVLFMDAYSLTGYISALLFIDVLKQIEGPITKEKIIQKLESMKDYDFGGIKLTFNPENRQLLQTIWIDDGSDYLIKGITKKQVASEKIAPENSTSYKRKR